MFEKEIMAVFVSIEVSFFKDSVSCVSSSSTYNVVHRTKIKIPKKQKKNIIENKSITQDTKI